MSLLYITEDTVLLKIITVLFPHTNMNIPVSRLSGNKSLSTTALLNRYIIAPTGYQPWYQHITIPYQERKFKQIKCIKYTILFFSLETRRNSGRLDFIQFKTKWSAKLTCCTSRTSL
jgi:hypothetical protein